MLRQRSLPRAFGTLRSRSGSAPESSKRIYATPVAFLRASRRVSSPFGLSEGPYAVIATPAQASGSNLTKSLRTQRSNLSPTPNLEDTPAASDHLLRHCSPARILNVYRYASGAAWLAFLESGPTAPGRALPSEGQCLLTVCKRLLDRKRPNRAGCSSSLTHPSSIIYHPSSVISHQPSDLTSSREGPIIHAEGTGQPRREPRKVRTPQGGAPANGREERSYGKCHRKHTAEGESQARVKRWGKSPPRSW